MSRRGLFIFALITAATLAGCGNKNNEQDAAPPEDVAVGGSEKPIVRRDLRPDKPPLTAFKVAAIQYDGDFKSVPGCSDDLCGISYFIKEAKSQGAHLAVTAEYALGQTKLELLPTVGDQPITDSRWEAGSITKTLAKLALDLEMKLVFNLITKDASGSKFNTSVAVDESGKVVARHRKFDLYGGESVTSGTMIDADDFFQTPAGKTGMLICADVECLPNGLTCVAPTCPDCAPTSPDILKAFAAQKPAVILFSASWTVGGSGVWGSIPIQKSIAKNFAAYVAASNTTGGQGRGGGIYKPNGDSFVVDSSGTPVVLYAELPLKSSP
jgi:predicted amidohydrolase